MTARRDSDSNPRRPLTARSVIASTLLGVDPPRLPSAALVRSGELFGLSRGATRTALSRMAASDEVVADDGGYALAGPLLERHGRQQAARRPRTSPWDGTWEMAVVTAERRTAEVRSAFRGAARRLKLAEVREGCWARPANLASDRSPRAAETVAAQCVLLEGATPDDVAPLTAAFAPDDWAVTAEFLIDEMDRDQAGLDRGDIHVLGSTFVVAAHVLRHLVADPLLPEALLPADWPGARLRSRYERFDVAFSETWRSWYRSELAS